MEHQDKDRVAATEVAAHFYEALAGADVWGSIPALMALSCEAERTIAVGDDELVGFGHYRGAGWQAPFVHDLRVRDRLVASLEQLTDTRCWPTPPGAEAETTTGRPS